MCFWLYIFTGLILVAESILQLQLTLTKREYIGNWKLGSNSFLTHGYYIYKYLLLGKMRFDDGIYHMVLGVPGVYSNREKYMANMFGFDQFVPVKNNGTRTGEFGYWVVEVRE